MIEFFD